MRRFALTAAVLMVGALLAGNPSVPRSSVAAATLVVGDGDACTPPLVPTYSTINGALMAANVNDTIFVCEGTYEEPTLILDKSGMFLLGPGSTPEDDGVATITKAMGSGSATVRITAAGVTVSGFTVDATPQTNISTFGIQVEANGARIADNVVIDTVGIGHGISVGAAVPPDNVEILRNHLSNHSNVDFSCDCRHGIVLDNVFTNAGDGYLQVTQDDVNFSGNNLTGTKATINSDNARIENNVFDLTGTTSFPLQVRGENVVFNLNQVLNAPDEVGLIVAQMQDGPTSVSITGNMFASLGTGILARDGFDDAFGVVLTIGGSTQTANVFLNSGKALGDGNYLLDMADVHDNAMAEFNDWGYCSLAEIEKEIYDGADEPGVGVVDYDPFVSPDPCPTVTATPSPTPTDSSTPTASPTQSPTPSPTLPSGARGNADCQNGVTINDFIVTLGDAAGLDAAPCAEEADVDCDGLVEVEDAFAILLHVGIGGQFQTQPCQV